MAGRPGAGSRPSADERDRLRHLAAYDLLDTDPEAAFDDLALLASTLTAAPIALISLVDAERQWFKARVGLDIAAVARKDAFCDWTIRATDQVLVVPDALLDPRFADTALVVGEPHIRFYAGMPLLAREGTGIGAVCVIDQVPRAGLEPAEEAGLRLVAHLLERLLELRRVTLELERSRARATALLEQTADLALVVDRSGMVTWASSGFGDVRHEAAPVGASVLALFHEDDVPEVAATLLEAIEQPGRRPPFEGRVRFDDRGWRWLEVVLNNQLHDVDVEGIVVQLRDVTRRRAADDRVRKGERRLADAHRVARMGSWEHDLVDDAMSWSAGLSVLLGLDPATAEPSAARWRAGMRPEERAPIARLVAQAAVDGRPFTYRRHVVLPDGGERLLLCHGQVEPGSGGRQVLRGTAVDITEQTALEESLEHERRFLSAVLDNVAEGVVACDADGVLSLFNAATERLHGTALERIRIDETPNRYRLFEPDGVTPLAADDVPLRRAFSEGRVTQEEIVIAEPGGERHLVSCTGQAIVDEQGRRIGAVVSMRDVTAQRRMEERLRRLADHDVLTGLPNRAVLWSRLEALIQAGRSLAVLFVDLDGFKRINDEHGHHVGDEVLAAVGERLRSAVKEEDTAARLGGDEFVVLLPGVDDVATASHVADRLEEVVGATVKVGDLLLHPVASIGVAVAGPDGVGAAALLSRADRAMYEIKLARRGPTGGAGPPRAAGPTQRPGPP